MILTPATAAQADSLARVHAQAFAAPWSPSQFADLFEGPGVFGFLTTENIPIGMILCRAVFDEAEILTLAVSPPVRRRGLARALVEAAAEAARVAGAGAMFLEVAADNAEALALYESLDFRRAGLRVGYYERGALGRVDAIVMRRALNAEQTSAYP